MRHPSATEPALDAAELSDEGFVHHCYVRAFRRPCHLYEATRALSLLTGGCSRESLWREIKAEGDRRVAEPASALEARIGRLLVLEGREFVRAAYRLALLRQVDREGLETYLAAMRKGMAKSDILGSLLESEEALRLPSSAAVAKAFAALTGPAGKATKPLSVGDLRELSALDTTFFVERAYHIILGRDPDPDGRSHYESRIARGRTKGRVMAELSSSHEAQRRPRTLAAALMLRILHYL